MLGVGLLASELIGKCKVLATARDENLVATLIFLRRALQLLDGGDSSRPDARV